MVISLGELQYNKYLTIPILSFQYLGSLAGGGLLLLTLSAVDDNLPANQNHDVLTLPASVVLLRGYVESVDSSISFLGVLMICNVCT